MSVVLFDRDCENQREETYHHSNITFEEPPGQINFSSTIFKAYIIFIIGVCICWGGRIHIIAYNDVRYTYACFNIVFITDGSVGGVCKWSLLCLSFWYVTCNIRKAVE